MTFLGVDLYCSRKQLPNKKCIKIYACISSCIVRVYTDLSPVGAVQINVQQQIDSVDQFIESLQFS